MRGDPLEREARLTRIRRHASKACEWCKGRGRYVWGGREIDPCECAVRREQQARQQ